MYIDIRRPVTLIVTKDHDFFIAHLEHAEGQTGVFQQNL